MANLIEIQEQIKALQSQAESIMTEQRASVIADIRQKMSEFQLTAADIKIDSKGARIKSATRATSSNPAPIKFRGPNGETWSGRGLAPRWMAAQIESGKKKEDFLVDQEAAK